MNRPTARSQRQARVGSGAGGHLPTSQGRRSGLDVRRIRVRTGSSDESPVPGHHRPEAPEGHVRLQASSPRADDEGKAVGLRQQRRHPVGHFVRDASRGEGIRIRLCPGCDLPPGKRHDHGEPPLHCNVFPLDHRHRCGPDRSRGSGPTLRAGCGLQPLQECAVEPDPVRSAHRRPRWSRAGLNRERKDPAAPAGRAGIGHGKAWGPARGRAYRDAAEVNSPRSKPANPHTARHRIGQDPVGTHLPLLPEEVGMRSGADQVQFVALNTVDDNPVRFQMGIATPSPCSREQVIPVPCR